jgi:multiple sugar transport system substrate-binding protein
MKRRLIIGAVAATAAALVLTACGSTGGSGGGESAGSTDGVVAEAEPITAQEMQDVLDGDEDIDLTLWAWAVTQYTPAIEAFEKKYPHIKVNLVVESGSTDMYAKYQNAVEAKTGIPDVMQWEYFAIPQYAVAGSLLNFGSDSIESEVGSLYSKSAWNDVHVAGGLYGIPTDQGPTVMFYRQDILDQFGLEVPTTWEQFEQEGVALHQADPSKYLAYLPVDTTAESFVNMLRYADAKPWSVDGLTSVTLDMQNDTVKEVTDYLRRCIDEGVFKVVSTASDEFVRLLSEGDVALGIQGAWRSGGIKADLPEQAGDWRVAVPPVWGDGGTQQHNSVSGGSAFAVSPYSSREKQVAAVAFANWISSQPESVDILVEQGLFSAANVYQDDADAAAVTDDYFGGQTVNKVFFEAADAVNSDWPTLPFMQEVNTTFNDTVLPTLTDGSDIFAAVGEWQDRIRSWAEDQGFTITGAK